MAMGGCGRWFLIMLILCLFFGVGHVFAVIFSMIGYVVLGFLVLALLFS